MRKNTKFFLILTLIGLSLLLIQAKKIIEIPHYALGGQDVKSSCPTISNTPNFTFAYGEVQLNGFPASIGTIVLAKSPRGDIVGCTEVSTTGYYGAMYIYGEDTSVTPAIPGIRSGETVQFLVENLNASTSNILIYSNDRNLHEINLTAVGETAPISNFGANITSGVKPLTVQFTDQTIGTATSWLWNFGDGNTSVLQSPSHTYLAKGVYTVSLTSTGPAGSTTETKSNYITVYDPTNANFTASMTSGIAPFQANFTNTSSGDYSMSNWSFGDGSTSTLNNPSHTYSTVGIYTVSLTVSGLGSSDTETKTGYISVYQPVSASFIASPTSGNSPLLVNFTNTSTGDFSSILWSFGDGSTSSETNPTHSYLSIGTYTVSLTVSGNGGVDEEVKTDLIIVTNNLSQIFLPLIVK